MKKEKRSCGSCTACCEGWLVINTEAVNAYPGHPCNQVNSGKGCKIYETRPCDPCRNFFVAGYQKAVYFLTGWNQNYPAQLLCMKSYRGTTECLIL